MNVFYSLSVWYKLFCKDFSLLFTKILSGPWWGQGGGGGAVQRGTKGKNNWNNCKRLNNKKHLKKCWKKFCLVEPSAVTPSASTSVSRIYLTGVPAPPHVYSFYTQNVSGLYLRSPAPGQNPLRDLSCLTIGNYKALPGRPRGWGCCPLHIDLVHGQYIAIFWKELQSRIHAHMHILHS